MTNGTMNINRNVTIQGKSKQDIRPLGGEHVVPSYMSRSFGVKEKVDQFNKKVRANSWII